MFRERRVNDVPRLLHECRSLPPHDSEYATPRFARVTNLEALREAIGGELGGSYLSRGSADSRVVASIAMPAEAGEGALAPVLRAGMVEPARRARLRGARLLVDAALASRIEGDWIHPHAAWAMASLLDLCEAVRDSATLGDGCNVHSTAVLMPGVTLGARVSVGPYAVIGEPGFGWAHGPDGQARAMPHLGGVTIEDDVFIGAHVTVHAGVLGPTRIGARTKIDAHVHVGHNSQIGSDCFIAAQSGLAGSVVLGRGVLVGGQAGFADHVHVGDGAKIGAKSGVIGDVPAGATFAGYPAMARVRWLRAIAASLRSGRRA